MPGIYPDLRFFGIALQQGRTGRTANGRAAEQAEYQQLTQNHRESRDEGRRLPLVPSDA
ncbi:hypothetical protein D3C73_1411610 [compost metagenome]